jgi:hypothetical protein
MLTSSDTHAHSCGQIAQKETRVHTHAYECTRNWTRNTRTKKKKRTHMHTHVYLHMHTHTHTHTHTHAPSSRQATGPYTQLDTHTRTTHTRAWTHTHWCCTGVTLLLQRHIVVAALHTHTHRPAVKPLQHHDDTTVTPLLHHCYTIHTPSSRRATRPYMQLDTHTYKYTLAWPHTNVVALALHCCSCFKRLLLRYTYTYPPAVKPLQHHCDAAVRLL